MSVCGTWKTATIAASDTTSTEIDLGDNFDFMNVIIPTITNCKLSVQVAQASGGTFYDLGDGTVTSHTITGNFATVFEVGGYQFVKIKSSVTQAAERSFEVRGFDR